MTILRGSFYSPARGGHAPGDLREAFAAAIELFAEWEAGPEPVVEIREQVIPISALCGMLWSCNDILPSIFWSRLAMLPAWDAAARNGTQPQRQTYAAVARWLRQQIVDSAPAAGGDLEISASASVPPPRR